MYGNTALHLASLKGHFKIVELLLLYNASTEKQNNELFMARELTQSV
jgi:ankyrin repeat protein